MQHLMKINLKLNLKSNLSGVPLQNNMKRQISVIIFTHCDSKSVRSLQNAPVLTNIHTDSIPTPPPKLLSLN